MFNKKTKFTIILTYFCFSSLAQTFITKFDVNLLMQKDLPEYIFKWQRMNWNFGQEYVFSNTSGEYIYLTVGLHKSEEMAQSIAQNYIDELSIRMVEGSSNIYKIGDKLWIWPDGINDLTNIVFTRNNALLILSSHKFSGSLISFAEYIDNLILIKDSIIKTDIKIQIPVIQPIVVYEGTTGKVQIKFTNESTSETINYQFFPGITGKNGQYEILNFDKYKQDLNFNDTIKVVGINQFNVVSEIINIEIK